MMLRKNNYASLFLVFLFLIFITTSTFALSSRESISSNQVPYASFDVLLDIKSPNLAVVTEKWKFDFENEAELNYFKEKILNTNINIEDLQNINPDLKPHVYINDYSSVKIGFDEVDKFVRIEYTINDLCLIKYLDYDEQIIWQFNENLFRQFTLKNLYHVPKDSYLKIKTYEPLLLGESKPQAKIVNDMLVWSGISSNDLKVLFIEKKLPKPTFLVYDFFKDFDITNNYFVYFMFALLVIVVVLLIFKKRVSKNIKDFVVKNSKIKFEKNNRDIVDFKK